MRTEQSPVYLLNHYMWAVLKENTQLDEGDYADADKPSGRVPIVPVSEEPLLRKFSYPYIVYGYSLNPSGTDFYQKVGSLTYVIYANHFEHLTKIVNTIDGAFERFDESAKSVNSFTTRMAQANPSISDMLLGVRFGEIHVGFAEGGSPEDAPDSEGGRITALLNMRFTYFVDYDIDFEPPAPVII